MWVTVAQELVTVAHEAMVNLVRLGLVTTVIVVVQDGRLVSNRHSSLGGGRGVELRR